EYLGNVKSAFDLGV
ncbi:hypothetical protein A2U01_0103542, partial [Trifolium medium]|nr:hypothetical protein [Trifolium medium]